MDPAALASALMTASAGQFQTAIAGKMLAMNVDEGRSAVKLIDAATQNIASLATFPPVSAPA
jgi:hypothetical protein